VLPPAGLRVAMHVSCATCMDGNVAANVVTTVPRRPISYKIIKTSSFLVSRLPARPARLRSAMLPSAIARAVPGVRRVVALFAKWRMFVVKLDRAIELFLDHRRLAGRAAETLRLYGQQLELWRTWRAEHAYPDVVAEVDIAELRAFFVYLRQEHVPYKSPLASRPPLPGGRLTESGIAAHWRTLRAFWRFLDHEEQLTPTQARFFRRIDPPHVPEEPRPACDEATLGQLLAACGDGADEQSARDRTIFLLLSESGMRIAELCSLSDRQADIRLRRAKIRGKGAKYRAVFWRPASAGALARYLPLRRGASYDPTSDAPLLRGCSIRNNGLAITPNLVRSLIKRRAADAGVDLPYGAPLHFLRHGFAHDALDAGADISEVSQLLGHASLTTTMRYLRENDDRLHDTYDETFGAGEDRKSSRRT
jgi:site-specific recombinase XerD